MALIVALLFLAGWAVWAFAARVSIVAVSKRGRLEARRAVHQLAVPADGTVASARLTLGRRVRRGEVLLEMDTREESIRRTRSAADVAALERRIAAMNAQLAAAADLAAAQARSSEARLQQAVEETAQARQLARIERARADQAARLGRDGLVSQTEVDESARRAEAAEARVRGLVAAEEQARKAAGESAASAESRRRELESERIELEQQLAVARNAVRSADLAIERLRVRAPVDGRVISSVEPKPGLWLAAGEKLCSILPDDRVEVAAWFPLEAMPMIRVGQPASVWINGLAPQARTVARATVAAVEQDPTGSEFRVRLRLDSAPASAATLGQGFPAVAVVQIQRVSPFQALLRAAGMARSGT
ncbi:MAG TPA: HlyD family efflux transporter periplasmic adaptor subunit [Thermoanaerobaculia bacterium]|nr:HlyD family efflux transporter periplasmic adaptor subunit [Thermoanaerobaculia bacterium]